MRLCWYISFPAMSMVTSMFKATESDQNAVPNRTTFTVPNTPPGFAVSISNAIPDAVVSAPLISLSSSCRDCEGELTNTSKIHENWEDEDRKVSPDNVSSVDLSQKHYQSSVNVFQRKREQTIKLSAIQMFKEYAVSLRTASVEESCVAKMPGSTGDSTNSMELHLAPATK